MRNAVSIPISQIWILKVERSKISWKDQEEGGLRETDMLWSYGFCQEGGRAAYPAGPVSCPAAGWPRRAAGGSVGRWDSPMLTPSDHLLQSPELSGHPPPLLGIQARGGKAQKNQK